MRLSYSASSLFGWAPAALLLVFGTLPAAAQVRPLTVTEEAILVSADIEPEDDFGAMVGFSRRNAVIGVRSDDDACPDDPECESGSAYIFERSGPAGWVEVAKLVASDAQSHGYFGRDVDMDGDTAIVGADLTNGRQGGVYVYERDLGGADAWGEFVKLLPEGTDEDQQFGSDVAIDGDTIVAAARLLNTVFVFARSDAGEWVQEEPLVGSTVEPHDVFGMFVSVHEDTILIGAQGDDDRGENAGAAYIFERNSRGLWRERAKVTAADAEAGDFFGRHGAVHGDFAAIGAPEEGAGCPSDPTCQSGAVYIFERNHGGANRWGQVAKITPHDPNSGAFYGRAVDLFDKYLVIGAPGDDEVGHTSGAVYLYRRAREDSSSWLLIDKVMPAELEPRDRFAYSVAIDGPAFVVGADFDDTIFEKTGSAFVFRIGPALVLEGSGSCPGQVTFDVSAATPSGPVALFAGTDGGSYSLPQGACQETVLDIGDAHRPRRVVTADSEGHATAALDARPSACGKVLQAVDLSTCRTSNVIAMP